jgi:tRNA dimethylallyltransferase
MKVLALFGPTAIGKTGVAIALADRLRRRGEDPVAVNCDSIQVYRGLEVLSGAATAEEQGRLEHRLLSFVPVDEQFSAGRFVGLAHAEIDELLERGRRPILVGGTGLYMRVALSDLDLRPPVSAEVREQVEREIAERGPEALHRELEPALATAVHPNDRKRIARMTELRREGIEPARSSKRLWSEGLRRPTDLFGLTIDRDELRARIERRVERMLGRGAAEEARSAVSAGASRTSSAAIGLEQALEDDAEGMRSAQWRYARRQLTWMRRMEDVRRIDRTGLSDAEVADRILGEIAD